ncbi:moesin-like [Dendronephthya gigantea]|uniref:moesin-like n=1 Tax=Dendronephthya gigantea TaxID=151771 RepID=UPI00106B5B94|nr:moesin-like [Dendronephthya gigantea]
MEQNKRLEGELNESRERSEAESIKLQKEKEKNSGHLKQIEELLANRKELEREISIQKQELKRRYTEIEIQKANFQVVTLSNVKLLSELDKERREKKQLETSSCDVLSCIASENEILQQQNLILAEDFADEQFDRQTVEAERVNEEERLAQLEQQNLTLHESCDVLSCIANESEILQQQNLILAEDFADEQFHRQMVEAERVNLEELLSQLEQQNLNLRQEIESVFPFMADENEILREQISELNDELQDERDRNDVLQRVMAIMARAHMRLGNGVAGRARRGFGIGVLQDERDRNDVLQRVMAIMARAHMRLGNGVARRARRGFGIGVVPDALG